MDDSKKAELLKGMFAGATFYKSVVAGVAESGSTVCYEKNDEEKKREGKVKPTADQIAKALAKVSDLFWGNSSYAVPFCVLRDCYLYHDNRSEYEREIALMPPTLLPDYVCTPGVVSSTFSDNKYMELNIDRWEMNNAPNRVLRLMEGFKKAMKELEGKK